MRRAFSFVFVVALASPALAAFEDMGAGARAPGLGDAFAAVADDVYAVHYNPAGLAVLERPMLGTSYSQLFVGLGDNSSLSNSFVGYAQPIHEGRAGVLGLSWESFSLNSSLYRDQTLSLAYGGLTPLHPFDGNLYAGATLKYLYSSFGNTPEATNATNGLTLTGQPDPVLNGSHSGSWVDSDLGLLYRLGGHDAVGLKFSNVNQPNVAFSAGSADRLPLEYALGYNHYTLLSVVEAQIDERQAPDGTSDHVFTAAGERWFPFRYVGEFGGRGALSIGSRQFTQVSAGVSYRTGRLQVDYSFALPINSVASTDGSHRIALSFRFGTAPADDEETLEALLESMRGLTAPPTAVYKSETKGLTMTQQTTLEEYLIQAKALEQSAHYKEAFEKLSSALGVAPADRELIAKFTRLTLVAQSVPALPNYKTDPMEAALHQGLLSYLNGEDQKAVEQVSKALQLKPQYHELDLLLTQLERLTGVRRPPVPEEASRLSYAGLSALTRATSAIQDGRNDEAVELSRKVLLEDPKNAAAWENLGTAYFALQDYEKSIDAWRNAYGYETNPAIRYAIRGYLKSVSKARQQRPARGAAKTAEPNAGPTLTLSQRQDLYNKGVDFFTHRDFEKARAAFEEILKSAPDDIEAQKALLRVKEEMQ